MIKKDFLAVHFDPSISLIPCNPQKEPLVKKGVDPFQIWKLDSFPDNSPMVAIVAGTYSGNIWCIDVDCKYDLTGTLMDDLMDAMVDFFGREFMSKLTIEQTPSGGWHIVFRSTTTIGNPKLARRLLTDDEKIKAKNPNGTKTLIEVKCERGYFVCWPSQGYKLKRGDFMNIVVISEDDAKSMIKICESFDEITEQNDPTPKLVKNKPQQPTDHQTGERPGDHYNREGDILGLLQHHGWSIVSSRGKKTFVRHPSATTKTSGNWDESKRVLFLFSPNSNLPSDVGLSPFAIYAHLETNGDLNKAAKQLAELGYGEQKPRHENHVTKTTSRKQIEKVLSKINIEKVLSDINSETTINSVIAENSEEFAKLLDEYENGVKMGRKTGIPTLDRHFLHKDANFVMWNGLDNVGKSTVVWYLILLDAIINGAQWVICCKENKVHSIMRKLIEFYYGCQFRRIPKDDLNRCFAFIDNSFRFYRSESDLDAYDVINFSKELDKTWKSTGLFIDPYNALAPGDGAENKHEYDFEVLRELNNYKFESEKTIYMTAHCGTPAARRQTPEGYKIAPSAHDTEGGLKFSSRSDDFGTIHRITNHENPMERRIVEVHIRRVREQDTGGTPTPFNQPVQLLMDENRCVFYYFDEKTNGWINPLASMQSENIPKSIIGTPSVESKPYGAIPHPDARIERIDIDDLPYDSSSETDDPF